MKTDTLVLIAAAGVAGWHLAKKHAATKALAAGKVAVTSALAPAPAPTVIERVYVEEYPYPAWGWGYPSWGGGWGGRRRPWGGHHGGHGHGGHGGGRRGGGGRGGRR